jgi:hypothetical protein
MPLERKRVMVWTEYSWYRLFTLKMKVCCSMINEENVISEHQMHKSDLICNSQDLSFPTLSIRVTPEAELELPVLSF